MSKGVKWNSNEGMSLLATNVHNMWMSTEKQRNQTAARLAEARARVVRHGGNPNKAVPSMRPTPPNAPHHAQPSKRPAPHVAAPKGPAFQKGGHETGSRGGTYYINRNGKKTYVSRK